MTTDIIWDGRKIATLGTDRSIFVSQHPKQWKLWGKEVSAIAIISECGKNSAEIFEGLGELLEGCIGRDLFLPKKDQHTFKAIVVTADNTAYCWERYTDSDQITTRIHAIPKGDACYIGDHLEFVMQYLANNYAENILSEVYTRYLEKDDPKFEVCLHVWEPTVSTYRLTNHGK